MAAARLTDSQKQELVRRFRQGESTQALAEHYGCSTTTVTRLARAEIQPKEYAALLERRQKKGGRDQQIPLAIASEPASQDGPALASPSDSLGGEVAEAFADEPLAPATEQEAPLPTDVEETAGESTAGATGPLKAEVDVALEPEDGPATVLAIDDADDFAAEEESDDDLLTSDDDGPDDDDEANQAMGDFHAVAVLPITVDDQRETLPAPWSPAHLPSCAYLLVDKTVELQARPLAEMPELGRLPSEEQQRQALVLFTNPRQAKRQCGRTQRVIKLPDPALLGRTAPYLLAQGISRVVIEGALYALPEPQ
jgi:hypothetical protein